jgi:hypothetical protein
LCAAITVIASEEKQSNPAMEHGNGWIAPSLRSSQ